MLVTEDNVASSLRAVEGRQFLVVDTETTGLRPWRSLQPGTQDAVCGVALHNGHESFYFPFRHSGGGNLDLGHLQHLLRIISATPLIYGHNLKFDQHFLAAEGDLKISRIVDTMFAAHLADENQPLSLKHQADKHLGANSSAEDRKLRDILLSWGYQKNEMWRLSPELVAPYAESDVDLTYKLAQFYDKRFVLEMRNLWGEVNEFGVLVAEMENRGIQLDVPLVRRYLAEAQTRAHDLETIIWRQSNYSARANSPADVARWLGLPDSKEETLVALKSRPGVEQVLEYRSWRKAVDTYYRRYLELVDPDDVIHANFRITGTVSGRLSCSDPNLMAVPRRSEAQKVKDVFVARPGYTFVELDYSQAEIRVAAHYTEEQGIIAELSRREGDIHTKVAEQVGISRQTAKILNFSVIYGAGAARLAEQMGVSEKEADTFLRQYHDTYPGYRRMSRAAKTLAEERGFVRLFTGRLRHFTVKDARPKDALNAVIQGGVAEMTRRAMLAVRKTFNFSDARILLQVHDSLLLEVKTELLHDVIAQVRTLMEDQPWCSVPIFVDCKTGPSWGGLESYGKKPT